VCILVQKFLEAHDTHVAVAENDDSRGVQFPSQRRTNVRMYEGTGGGF
jgi:hypothetical protein